jgi:hypothetical protein
MDVTKMTRISISDLQNQSAQSLLSLLKDEKNGLIIDAINRALNSRKISGGFIGANVLSGARRS